MTRTGLALTLLLLTASTASAQFEQQNRYGWRLSDSAVSQFSNIGAAPTQGLLTLYLWLDCSLGSAQGMSAAEFDLVAPAGSSILGFTPMNGFLNAGGPTNLLLATPCTVGPVTAGSLQVLDLGAGDYCIVSSAENGKNVSVDCSQFLEWDNDTVGYGNNGTLGCVTLSINCEVSTEDSSWGSVKALYR